MHTADSAAVHRVAEYLKMHADCVLLDFCVGGEAIIPIKDIKKLMKIISISDHLLPRAYLL